MHRRNDIEVTTRRRFRRRRAVSECRL